MGFWVWEKKSQRYRVTAEGAKELGRRPGTFIGRQDMVNVRDLSISRQKDFAAQISDDLVNERITIGEWTQQMRNMNRDATIQQYALGAGGRQNLTQSDYGRIGSMVRRQNQYLDNFVRDIEAGRISEGRIAGRARMYAESSSHAFERASILTRGMPDLPQYPGDGSTICLTNCKCYWRIVERADRWDCYWEITPVENCETCLEYNRRWNPLTLDKAFAPTRSVAVEMLPNGSHTH